MHNLFYYALINLETELDILFNRRKQLKNAKNEKEKKELDEVEDKLAELCGEKNKAKIEEAIAEISAS